MTSSSLISRTFPDAEHEETEQHISDRSLSRNEKRVTDLWTRRAVKPCKNYLADITADNFGTHVKQDLNNEAPVRYIFMNETHTVSGAGLPHKIVQFLRVAEVCDHVRVHCINWL